MNQHKEPDSSPSDTGEQLQEAVLYPGDTGRLPLDARRVFVQLLAGPSVDRKRHSNLWPALLQHQEVIRSRLSELFLELVLDADLEVAFTRRADTGDLDAPILLRRASLTFIQSVLMLYLRQLITEAAARGERAVVSGEEMLEQMRLYEHSDNSDPAGFEKRVRAAIDKVKDISIISPIRGSDDRYEISPTLKLLFSAEEISALKRQYEKFLDKSSQENT